MRDGMAIREARPGEGEALSALCRRSKQHWGYDEAFMARCAASLSVSRTAIDEGRVFVASTTAAPEKPLGVAELARLENGVIDLDKLFVDPPAIGHGIGAALFAHAVRMARQSGARRLTILADPNATAFYERLGARFLRLAPSDAIPGRELPLYELDLRVGPPFMPSPREGGEKDRGSQ